MSPTSTASDPSNANEIIRILYGACIGSKADDDDVKPIYCVMKLCYQKQANWVILMK